MDKGLEILTLGIKEAWNVYKIKIDNDEDYRKVRFGIKIKFDLNDYLKNRIVMKSKIGKVIVRGNTHNLTDFDTELEEREKIMKVWLENEMGDDDIISPRTYRGEDYGTN